MRITFVLPPLSRAGGMRVVAVYAHRLRARGHDVQLVSVPQRTSSLARRMVQRLRGEVVRRPRVTYFDGLPLHVVESWRPITDADVPDADVVIATYWQTAPWVAALAPAKGAKAYFMQDYGTPGQPLERVVPTWSLPLHLITIAQWLVDLIHEHVGKPVELVPNAVDTTLFTAPPRGRQPVPTVGFVYVALWSKGADLCLAAAARARDDVPDLRLLTFGQAPRPDLPLPAWAEHLGRLGDERLAAIYAACDAWLFGSRSEGFGLPILEAMACRTPVIATPAGAAPQLLAGGGGLLVRPMHPDALAAAIVRLCRMSEGEWQALSAAAYRTATSYTWDDATERFEAALHRARLTRGGALPEAVTAR
jgi:glycosyltransferase involved in cell wall biosynthesis